MLRRMMKPRRMGVIGVIGEWNNLHDEEMHNFLVLFVKYY
jgi:hypothetical protein